MGHIAVTESSDYHCLEHLILGNTPIVGILSILKSGTYNLHIYVDLLSLTLHKFHYHAP